MQRKTLSLPSALVEQIEETAKKENRSFSNAVTVALKQYFLGSRTVERIKAKKGAAK